MLQRLSFEQFVHVPCKTLSCFSSVDSNDYILDVTERKLSGIFGSVYGKRM